MSRRSLWFLRTCVWTATLSTWVIRPILNALYIADRHGGSFGLSPIKDGLWNFELRSRLYGDILDGATRDYYTGTNRILVIGSGVVWWLMIATSVLLVIFPRRQRHQHLPTAHDASIPPGILDTRSTAV